MGLRRFECLLTDIALYITSAEVVYIVLHGTLDIDSLSRVLLSCCPRVVHTICCPSSSVQLSCITVLLHKVCYQLTRGIFAIMSGNCTTCLNADIVMSFRRHVKEPVYL